MAIRSTATVQQDTELRTQREIELNEQFPGVHPNALKSVRPGAKYVSRGRKEYYIKQDDKSGFWRIHQYSGGLFPVRLKGNYTKYSLAEQDLIAYLKSKDKFGKAIYPGCREP